MAPVSTFQFSLVSTLNYTLGMTDSTELPKVPSGEPGGPGPKSDETQDKSENARTSKESIPNTQLPGTNHA